MINWLCYKHGHCSDTPSFLLIPRYTNSPIDTPLTPSITSGTSSNSSSNTQQTSCWHVTNTRVAPAPSESLKTGRMRSAHCTVGRGWLACERKMWKIKKKRNESVLHARKNAECEINMFVKFQLWNMMQSDAGPSMSSSSTVGGLRCCWLQLCAATIQLFGYLIDDWLTVSPNAQFVKCAGETLHKKKSFLCEKLFKEDDAHEGYRLLTYGAFNFLGIGWNLWSWWWWWLGVK